MLLEGFVQSILQGAQEAFLWWGGLSKNVIHHGWSTRKNQKEALAKTPYSSPKKLKFEPKYKLFKISYWEFFF